MSLDLYVLLVFVAGTLLGAGYPVLSLALVVALAAWPYVVHRVRRDA